MSAARPSPQEALAQSEERFRLLVEGVQDYAIFMLDPQGRVVSWNAGAERIKGYRAAEIVGRHFSVFYPPEPLKEDWPRRELEAAERDGRFEDEGWRVRKNGTRFWANVVITAIRGDGGALLGFSKVTRDLSHRREQEESLRQSEERFRLLIEGVSDYAIFMLDPNGFVATWNSGAERIKGYRAAEVIGRHFSVFYPAEVRESGWPDHELRVAAESGRFVDEGWRLRQDGSTFWAHVTITALRNAGGRLIGFAKLTRDLSERRRAEALELAGREHELMLEAERSARIAAQRATRIKDEFLATLSHELRTPLSAIMGWTQVLRRRGDAITPPELARAVEVIDRNARAQVALIDELLDLSRIVTGKVSLQTAPTHLGELVGSVVESQELAARGKEIVVDADLDPALPPVAADAARLRQVVWNLLSNAIKFTQRAGQVRVALRQAGTLAELTVSDSGIGIPGSFLPFVFDRFTQRDSSISRTHGGLGLGLAISKQLVELHGGTIRAHSAGEGQGATFVVELPLCSSALNPEAGTPAADSVALPDLSSVHAFIVDDEADARELLQRVLQDQHARVTPFSNAEDALRALKATRPDIVISDIGMPRVDGYQFMRALRAGESGSKRLPALALSAFARAEDRQRSLQAGYQAHLSKPFDVTELMLLVSDLAAR